MSRGGCIGLVLVLSLGALCDGSDAHLNGSTTTNGSTTAVAATASSSPTSLPRGSAGQTRTTVMMGLPPDFHKDRDYLKMKATGNSNSASAPREACEAGLYPCDQDQWCSPSRKVCRPCSELEDWCNQTSLIHDRYTACERYCYRLQLQRVQHCEEDKGRLMQNLSETDWALAATRREAQEELAKCANETALVARERDKLETDREEQDQKLSGVMDQLHQCHQASFDWGSPQATGLLIGLVTSTLWAFAATAALVLKILKRRGDRPTAVENGDRTPSQLAKQDSKADNLPLLENKKPIEEHGRDEGVCAFAQEPRDTRVPGDSVLAPN